MPSSTQPARWGFARISAPAAAEAQGVNVVEPIWLVPPPGLGVDAAGTGGAAPAGDPSRRLDALVEGGAVAARMWALRGPETARRAWREHARLGLAVLDERLERPGGDADRFSLAVQASTLGQWAWLAGDADAGRRADLVACELATGGWPGRTALDQPGLVLLSDPTGLHALAHAGSRLRLGMIRDFPVASPHDGGSWKRPGTVDRLLDHVDRQAHLGGSLLGATARLLRTLVHPAVGPPWPRAAAVDAQQRLAFLAGRDAASWAFGLPWLLDTAERFPHRLAPLLAA
jgi:hypothetical protein